MVEDLADGIVIARRLGANAPLLYANRTFERLTGYSRILELSLCDANGKSLSAEEINDMPFDATKALAEIASEWNGLSSKAQKDLEKNSEPSQNEG